MSSSFPTRDAASPDNGPTCRISPKPENAWFELQKLREGLRPPLEWRSNEPQFQELLKFQRQLSELATLVASRAREFIERFPDNEHVGSARITLVDALNHAVAAGVNIAELQVQQFLASVLTDQNITDNERLEVFLAAGNATFFKKAGMRLFTEGMRKLQAESEANDLDNLRQAVKHFVTNPRLYTHLVHYANRAPPEIKEQLANTVINSLHAPDYTKTLAGHILNGTLPYELGKPVTIRFKALDGRIINLAALKGKVVLVEFWSMTCFPCIAEMPRLKAIYNRFHDRGFEIIGINLDDSELALRRFIKQSDVRWPQYFDGKGWDSRFVAQLGVFAVPTLWLVDKTGVLCSTEAQIVLEQEVARQFT